MISLKRFNVVMCVIGTECSTYVLASRLYLGFITLMVKSTPESTSFDTRLSCGIGTSVGAALADADVAMPEVEAATGRQA